MVSSDTLNDVFTDSIVTPFIKNYVKQKSNATKSDYTGSSRHNLN